MPVSATVATHYGDESLPVRVVRALESAGLHPGKVTWQDLAPLDQFHVRGLAATRELAQGLTLKPGETVLDVGCGLGGPARYLAAEYGCNVTGIDLSQPYVDVAQTLAAWSNLTDRVAYQQADALDLPFEDESFDHAWTQHVAMNIRDRAALYTGIHRVLKPSGSLAIYDIVAGNGEPLTFPVPWARTPDISFLLSPEDMRAALIAGGFTEVSWRDTTEASVAWLMEQQQRALGSSAGPTPLGLHVVMGPEFRAMAGNLAQALKDGRIRLIQAVLRRA